MATRERYQNPVLGDIINLRLFVFNSNMRVDPYEVAGVNIYWKDPYVGDFTLIESVTATRITHVEQGHYLLPLELQPYHTVSGSTEFYYRIGKYKDVWRVRFESDENIAEREQQFEVYPDLWYTAPLPVSYDFSFKFSPNKLRRGAKQNLIIAVYCNAPGTTEVEQYYATLSVLGNLAITIEVSPDDSCYNSDYPDLNKVVTEQPVCYTSENRGCYLLDTTILPDNVELYKVWFSYSYGGNIYLSDKFDFQLVE